ncbi:hypothetical protein [Caldanaerobius polysaccharolyticus]|uniref:hypothetical protein n=1 Tax=Caldanaerobius polysaccharolyticus TaxID=44256 RepID=UPI001C54EA33|nr:hypothetical protein [Caldanaerobius polysaccharolyticus]
MKKLLIFRKAFFIMTAFTLIAAILSGCGANNASNASKAASKTDNSLERVKKLVN